MKILWLYRYIPQYDYDNWLHLKFVEVLKTYPGIEVLAYGPDIHVGYPHLTTLPYNASLSIDDIKKHFDFDVMILNTKSRMFMDYNPHKNIASGEWLPKGFNLYDKPRIVIEEDYHYETSDEWYKQNRIDLILQRHWSQAQRQQTVPMKWFPFSVDINTFKPGVNPRYNKICFAGSSEAHAYIYRRRAYEALRRYGYVDVFANRQKQGTSYVECLKNYVAHLSCSSTFNLTPAKMFEIMASGSALLTNENGDLPLLFPSGSYYTYRVNNSNILQVGKEIIINKSRTEAVAKFGLETIHARHSHQVRIGELLGIINSINSGKQTA